MRVLILGGYGFVGAQLMAALSQRGHDVCGAGRDIAFARRRYAFWDWAAVDFADPPAQPRWAEILNGVDAVINCVGVLQDGGGDSTRTAHISGAESVFRACEANGVRRFIQISAVGAEPDAPTEYARSKAEGDARLRETGLDWVILKPSLIIGRTGYGGTALVRGLAGLPLVTPVSDPETRFRPVMIDDLAAAIDYFLAPSAPSRVTLDIAGPEEKTLGEIIPLYQDWLGFPRTRLWRPPGILSNLAFRAGDLLGRAGLRTPLRTTARRQMAYNVGGDAKAWTERTGIKPQTLREYFRLTPSTVEDRWRARLYFVKPFALLLFGLFWIASGPIALGPGADQARQLLLTAGVPFPLLALWMTAGLDILIGVGILSGRWRRRALIAAFGVSLIYFAGIILAAPYLLVDALGAGLKTVLAPIAALFLLAVDSER